MLREHTRQCKPYFIGSPGPRWVLTASGDLTYRETTPSFPSPSCNPPQPTSPAWTCCCASPFGGVTSSYRFYEFSQFHSLCGTSSAHNGVLTLSWRGEIFL